MRTTPATAIGTAASASAATAAPLPAALPTAPEFRKFICDACGYVYDEEKGDADGGLAPGTRFEDIPDDWSCPLCGVTKADLSPFDAPSPQALRANAAGASCAAPRGGLAGVVIVGGGSAGWQVAEALRALDAALPITLVSACAAERYDKPLLSVAVARRLEPAGLVKERGIDAAARLNLRLLANTHAVRICADTRTLRTTRGNLRYEHLVLAHGAQAMLPPALPASLVWRVNHLDAYRKLREALAGAPKDVLIVGAGLIGSELANDLALGGHRITLLDTQAEPLARWQAEEAGPRLLEAWKDLPIRFVGGVQVAKVEKLVGVTTQDCSSVARAAGAFGEKYRVATLCGREFEADLVIAATGLQTPSRLAQSADLAWNQGIAVRADTLRTSVARIHALGDCISVDGRATRFLEPIARQALAIAADICGRDITPYEPKAAPVRVKTTSLPMTLH